MMRRIILFTVSLWLISAMTLWAEEPSIRYVLSMPKPQTHLFQVEIQYSHWSRKTLEVMMPAWRTGRYMIMDFAGGVQDFTASTPGGAPLAWKKTDKETWEIQTATHADLVVRYTVYANDFRDRTRGLNGDHAFVDASAVLMYTNEYQKTPLTVQVVPFGTWHVTTGLEQAGSDATVFAAPDYETLADSPMEIGTQKDFPFEAEGKEHVLTMVGDGNYDAPRIIKDLKRIIAFEKRFWGELPYRRYVFMVELSPNSGGGTEHLNSSVVSTQPFVFQNPSSYRGFLGLISHEYFHTWNVKQLRPAAMKPYDFSKENYSRELWIAEGTTSYFSPLLMARYGYGSPSAYIESIANTVQQERSRPGNRKQSLTDCSFDAWIKYWRQNQNAYNAEADYYEKGSQVSMLLDLEIRNRSANAASLEDVLRELYRTRDHGYTVEDVQRIAERLCRSSLQEFFANYVEGTSPLPWEANLKYAGLALAPRDTLRRSWTGLNTYDSGDRTIVARVLDASPALDAGLEVNDELLAVNGYRARSADLAARVEESKPGQSIQVTVFRDGWLKEFDVSVGTQPVPAYTLVRVQSPTELQKAIYRSWLGEAWQ